MSLSIHLMFSCRATQKPSFPQRTKMVQVWWACSSSSHTEGSSLVAVSTAISQFCPWNNNHNSWWQASTAHIVGHSQTLELQLQIKPTTASEGFIKAVCPCSSPFTELVTGAVVVPMDGTQQEPRVDFRLKISLLKQTHNFKHHIEQQRWIS